MINRMRFLLFGSALAAAVAVAAVILVVTESSDAPSGQKQDALSPAAEAQRVAELPALVEGQRKPVPHKRATKKAAGSDPGKQVDPPPEQDEQAVRELALRERIDKRVRRKAKYVLNTRLHMTPEQLAASGEGVDLLIAALKITAEFKIRLRDARAELARRAENEGLSAEQLTQLRTESEMKLCLEMRDAVLKAFDWISESGELLRPHLTGQQLEVLDEMLHDTRNQKQEILSWPGG